MWFVFLAIGIAMSVSLICVIVSVVKYHTAKKLKPNAVAAATSSDLVDSTLEYAKYEHYLDVTFPQQCKTFSNVRHLEYIDYLSDTDWGLYNCLEESKCSKFSKGDITPICFDSTQHRIIDADKERVSITLWVKRFEWSARILLIVMLVYFVTTILN